ncbi:MAG: outer membrane protein [Methylocystis sp.]
MFRPFLRARATIASALLGALLAPASQAADFPAIAPPPPIEEGPVEWGSNWYLRGDVGWQNVEVPAITGNFANRFNWNDIVSGGIGGGYQFNEWIRADITVDRSVFRRNGAVGTFWCPYSATPLQDVNGDPLGIYADPNTTCSQFAKATLNSTRFMANAYIDLFHLYGFTPYIGGGVGLTYNQASSSLTYYRNTDGGIWAPDLTVPAGEWPRWVDGNGVPVPVFFPFAPTNWNTWSQRKSWQFAWNLMAGVSYDITENLKVDVGYRYLNAGKFTSLPAWPAGGGVTSKDITSHEVRVGFRVTTN